MPALTSKQDAIYQLLRDRIAGGELGPGTAIPTECQLTERYQVSRTIVRLSLRRLQTEGLIVRRKGAGSFVAPQARQRLQQEHAEARIKIGFLYTPSQVNNAVYMGILKEFDALRLSGIAVSLHLEEHLRFERYEQLGLDLCVIDGSLLDTFRLLPPGWPGKIIALNRASDKFNFLCTDNIAGGRLMARHLLRQGHRKIGVIHYGMNTDQDFVHRLKGIYDELAQNALQPALDLSILLHEYRVFSPHEAAEQMLMAVRRGEVTGVIVITDNLALPMYDVAEQLDLKAGTDFSLIGFDDQPYARYLQPTLTTLRQPLTEIAAKLGEVAGNYAAGARPFCAERIAPVLIERESVRTLME